MPAAEIPLVSWLAGSPAMRRFAASRTAGLYLPARTTVQSGGLAGSTWLGGSGQFLNRTQKLIW